MKKRVDINQFMAVLLGLLGFVICGFAASHLESWETWRSWEWLHAIFAWLGIFFGLFVMYGGVSLSRLVHMHSDLIKDYRELQDYVRAKEREEKEKEEELGEKDNKDYYANLSEDDLLAMKVKYKHNITLVKIVDGILEARAKGTKES